MKDIHFHIMEPYALVSAERFVLPAVENASCLVESLDRLGLKQANIPAISLYEPEDFPCNLLALHAKQLAPGRVYALAGLRYGLTREENENLKEQAYRLIEAGFDGFKMICKPNARRKLRFQMDDPMFDPFFEAAEKEQWPILYHVGDPATFWDPNRVPPGIKNGLWYYGNEPDLPSYEQLYTEVEGFMSRHPRLRVTFAHFFFLSWNLDRLDELLTRYPNMRVDVTPGVEMYEDFSAHPEAVRAFFRKHMGRILLGTDNVAENGEHRAAAEASADLKIARLRRFYETDEDFAWNQMQLKGIKLDRDVLQALFEGGFDAFLGGRPPREVNRDAAKKLCQELRGTAAASQHRQAYEKLYNELEAVFS